MPVSVDPHETSVYRKLQKYRPKKIVFELHGEKLEGKYTILQFGKEEKNWLFFKAKG